MVRECLVVDFHSRTARSNTLPDISAHHSRNARNNTLPDINAQHTRNADRFNTLLNISAHHSRNARFTTLLEMPTLGGHAAEVHEDAVGLHRRDHALEDRADLRGSVG